MTVAGVAPPRSTAWPAARLCHGAIAAVVLASLLLQIVLNATGGADVSSGESGESVSTAVRFWRMFSYFTIQSNLFVLAASLTLARNPTRDGPIWRVVRMDALLGIIITGLVFEIVLAPLVHLSGVAVLPNLGFHYIAPWATVIVWLVFGPRPRLTWHTVGAAFIWPFLWLAYIFTQGAFTRWYPYPFLDVTEIGLGTALRNVAFVVLLAAALAAAVKLLDGKLRPAP